MFREIIDSISESFKLERNEYTRIAAFKNNKNNLEKVIKTKLVDNINIKNF